jgi:hypothetical protein
MIVHALERVEQDDTIVLSVKVEGISGKKDIRKLWFRLPAECAGMVTERLEPFIAALIPVCMKLGQNLRVKGAVSERFLSGCEQIIDIWNCWYEQYRPVQIHADEVSSNRSNGNRILSFFSGGVDSFYTVLKNLDTEHGEERISHLMFVHGYDIPLESIELFTLVKDRLQKAAERLSLKLLVASTNLRSITDDLVDWNQEFGSGLAAIALCVSPGFKRAYIPSSDIFSTLSPRGSHPLIDPLWSNGAIDIRHDGCEASRIQKLMWYVGKSDTALRYLRVCFENYENSYNCGCCEKCLRTMIGLRIVGVHEKAVTFNRFLDLEGLPDLVRRYPVALEYIPDNLRVLRRTGSDPELERVLKKILSSAHRIRNDEIAENLLKPSHHPKQGRKMIQKQMRKSGAVVERVLKYLRQATLSVKTEKEPE